MRYLEDKFEYGTNRTTGIDFLVKIIKLDNGESVNVRIWDTSSGDRNMNSIGIYIRNANGIIIVYDISIRRTLDYARKCLDFINKEIPSNKIPIVLVGNKIDLDDRLDSYIKREISTEEGQEFANNHNLLFYETSAKKGTNVKECFDDLIHEILIKDHQYNNENENKTKFIIKKNNRPGKKSCPK